MSKYTPNLKISIYYKFSLALCCAVVAFFSANLFVYAGNIDSPAIPSNDSGRMYTLEQIYQNLHNGTSATKQSGGFAEPSSAPGSTMHTLDSIYNDFGADVTSTSGTTASNVLSGHTFFDTAGTTRGVNWGPVSGTIANCGDNNGGTCYLSNATKVALDSNLAAGNIASGTTIFGISGTLLKNEYSGSSTGVGSSCSSDTGYPQSTGGVDDYNGGCTTPSDAYGYTGNPIPAWETCISTACTGTDTPAGCNWCGTGDATYADHKDPVTGLVWSKWMYSGTAKDWFIANNCTDNSASCTASGQVACECTKLTGGSMTGCDSIGWRLPYQKELMQAYIDGSWGNGSGSNLSNTGYYYWSATTRSSNTYFAWYTSFSYGYANNDRKSNTEQVRCVR